MKFFADELRIVPRIVWPIALVIAAGLSFLFLRMPREGQLSRTETAFLLWGTLILFAWVVLIGYINADARRRGMRYVMWTLLAIFIPNFIGAILYFVLRDPLLVSCKKCWARCRANFAFCPECGAELSPSCPACKRTVEPGWNRCAYCGKELVQQTTDSMQPR